MHKIPKNGDIAVILHHSSAQRSSAVVSDQSTVTTAHNSHLSFWNSLRDKGICSTTIARHN